jgi:uncharacterized protein DUF6249
MDDFNTMFWPFSIPIVAIMGAFIYAIIQTISRSRVRELEVRERIAMIERGLVPPPEVDPGGFDRAMSRYERHRSRDDDWRRRTPGRYRSAGITMIGVGFGLMLLIGVAGDSPSSAVGVGGFLVVMGLAFFVNSWMERERDDRPFPPPPPPPPAPRSTASSEHPHAGT